MKIGTITTSNAKGQIVIPKVMRKALGMDARTNLNLVLRGKGIYLYPVKEVIGEHDLENSYLKILEKTAGAWQNEHLGNKALRKEKLELEASKKRKQAW